MYRTKPEGIHQKKHSCDNCTAHNRGVVQAMFRKVKMALCQHCLVIADKLAKQDATEREQGTLPLAA